MTPAQCLEAVKAYNTRKRAPDPRKAALLVIDMQGCFEGIAAPIIHAVERIIASCRAAGIPVIYTRHAHASPEKDGGMLAEWWHGDLILEGTPDARLLDAVAPRPGDRIVKKHRYSAFLETDLDDALRGLGRDEVIVSGVMTNLCCETTARDAFVRGFRVFFMVDGTATANDDLHVATLKNLAFGFAYLLTTDGLAAAIAPHG